MVLAFVAIHPFGDRLEPGRAEAFIVLAAFLVSFLAIRTSARLTRSVSWWPGGVQTAGLHIHHLVWGICLMILCGFLAFAAPPGTPVWMLAAVGFGVGVGFTLDEFALWVRLEDVYWAEEGRASFDAVVVAFAFAGLVVVGSQPFGLDEPSSIWGTALVVGLMLTLVAVSAAKNRVLLAVIGSSSAPACGSPRRGAWRVSAPDSRTRSPGHRTAGRPPRRGELTPRLPQRSRSVYVPGDGGTGGEPMTVQGRSTSMLRVAVLLAVLLAFAGASSTARAAPPSLGPNVIVFDPSMPVAQIQATVDAIHAQQVDDEMGTHRYALLFKPGVYGTAQQPLLMKVGYYTEVAGLGASPSDVTINGKIDVYNRCLDNGGTSNCVALVNFWRTLSNLTLNINGTGQDGCRASANFWAVSQASSMRRVSIGGGNLTLFDYCTAGPQFASGGFIADSRLPLTINGSQQQWLTRNSQVSFWTNAVWNQVFAGVEGAPGDSTFPNPPYTTLPATPVSREKPYLFASGDSYKVRVPAAHTGTRGISWAGGTPPGRTIPLDDFFVATPSDSTQRIDAALARGENLLLTPGVYDVSRSIAVKRPGTVVLGLGHATLTAVGGAIPLTVADVPGVIVAGVTIDAGTVESPALLRVGKHQGAIGPTKSDPADPTTLSDVYFRVGGPHVGKADVALEVNSDDVLIDHTWVWRADHGVEGLSDTERWNTNTGRMGVVVNGDDVTATGLFVEHFQQYNTLWNGERGVTILYQNELPYDPPSQADWMHDGVEGWAGYKVAHHVRTHSLYGGGVYVFNRNDPSIHTENGFEVPDRPGVHLHHVMTVNLGAGTIDHVVNGVGAAADTSRVGTPVYVTDYP